jgi:hypothetical protein
VSGRIGGTWVCKDCGRPIAYTARIVDSESFYSTKRIRAVVENDAELRDHAESHGHDRADATPLTVLLDVKL